MYFHDTKVLLRAYQNPQNASPSPRVSLEYPCLPPRGRWHFRKKMTEGECESSLCLAVAATDKGCTQAPSTASGPILAAARSRLGSDSY